MTKIAILGDTHLGCRSDSQIFYNFQETFFNEMIEYLVDNQITQIFQLGDLWDRRKYINFKTLDHAKKILFDPLRKQNITMTTLIGNHDIFWRESLAINSSSLLLGEYSNVNIIDKPTKVKIDQRTTIDLLPWICKENNQQVMEFIDRSKSDLCFGHLEIKTFAMYRGMESNEGYPSELFAKYELVCSGHYHTKSMRDNIHYVGSPYEITWQDYNDPRGFHIFDTETRQLTFHRNNNTVFARIEYDGNKTNNINIDLTNKFVKLVVYNKDNNFDYFLQKMYNAGCYELKIIEDIVDNAQGNITDNIDLDDTVEVMSKYIMSIEVEDDSVKEHLNTFMKNLYFEAIQTNGA